MEKIITFEENLNEVKLAKNPFLASELFEEMLPKVKTISDMKLLDKATQVFDSEVGGEVSIWAIPDSDYATKLHKIFIPEHLQKVQDEILSSCESYEDTAFLYRLVPQWNEDLVTKYRYFVTKIVARHKDLVQLSFATQTQVDDYNNLKLKCIGKDATEIALLSEVHLLNGVYDVITFCQLMSQILPKEFKDFPMQKNAYVLSTASECIQVKVFELLRSRLQADKSLFENTDVMTQRKLYALLPKDFFEDSSVSNSSELLTARLPLPETLVKEEFHKYIREIDNLITEYEENPNWRAGDNTDDDRILDTNDKLYDLIYTADRFFFGKEKETDELLMNTLSRYKKVLRNKLKKLSIEGLEDFYHHTTYNKISSQVVLARYDDVMKKQIIGLTPEKAKSLQGKVLSDSSTNRKIQKMLS